MTLTKENEKTIENAFKVQRTEVVADMAEALSAFNVEDEKTKEDKEAWTGLNDPAYEITRRERRTNLTISIKDIDSVLFAAQTGLIDSLKDDGHTYSEDEIHNIIAHTEQGYEGVKLAAKGLTYENGWKATKEVKVHVSNFYKIPEPPAPTSKIKDPKTDEMVENPAAKAKAEATAKAKGLGAGTVKEEPSAYKLRSDFARSATQDIGHAVGSATNSRKMAEAATAGADALVTVGGVGWEMGEDFLGWLGESSDNAGETLLKAGIISVPALLLVNSMAGFVSAEGGYARSAIMLIALIAVPTAAYAFLGGNDEDNKDIELGVDANDDKYNQYIHTLPKEQSDSLTQGESGTGRNLPKDNSAIDPNASTQTEAGKTPQPLLPVDQIPQDIYDALEDAGAVTPLEQEMRDVLEGSGLLETASNERFSSDNVFQIAGINNQSFLPRDLRLSADGTPELSRHTGNVQEIMLPAAATIDALNTMNAPEVTV